jgi:hypothetical protein
MSQEVGQIELQAKTRQLMDGPLKHIKAAVLAAALLPLASVAPASAQPAGCGSGGVCGVVFNDTNGNGIQDAGETGIAGAKVTIIGTATTLEVYTDVDGFYFSGTGVVPVGTAYQVAVLIGDVLQGMEASPSNVGLDDTVDSDGVVKNGFSVATGTLKDVSNSDTDFGFHASAAANPGTGTPGYWKNHPEAWPVDASGVPVTIMIGGVPYSKDAALTGLAKITKDKTTTMFSSLLSAKLNLLIGNDGSCLSGVNGDTIALADAWMAAHHLGTNVLASSDAWKIGEPTHQTLDAYNNGLLCAPHRQ